MSNFERPQAFLFNRELRGGKKRLSDCRRKNDGALEVWETLRK